MTHYEYWVVHKNPCCGTLSCLPYIKSWTSIVSFIICKVLSILPLIKGKFGLFSALAIDWEASQSTYLVLRNQKLNHTFSSRHHTNDISFRSWLHNILFILIDQWFSTFFACVTLYIWLKWIRQHLYQALNDNLGHPL